MLDARIWPKTERRSRSGVAPSACSRAGVARTRLMLTARISRGFSYLEREREIACHIRVYSLNNDYEYQINSRGSVLVPGDNRDDVSHLGCLP